MKKMKIKMFLGIGIIAISVPFVMSCSSNSSENSFEHSNSFKLINDFKKEKFFKPSNIQEIKSIITIDNSDTNKFISAIEKYLKLNNEFKNLLTKNNNEVLKDIKSITISPIVNTKSIIVNLFLNSSFNDLNLISERINDYFSSNFTYSKVLNIKKKSNPEIIESKKFRELFDAMKINEQNVSHDLTLLRNGFEISNDDLEFIKNNFNQFEIKKGLNYSINIKIKNDEYLKGTIFYISNLETNNYYPDVTSNQLAK